MTQSQPDPKPSNTITENEHVKKAVDTSQQYFRYALDVLKRPSQIGTTAGQTQFLNGIITQALFILIIPLITYVAFLAMPSLFRPSFFDAVLKTWFYLLIMMVCVNGAIFLTAKIGKSSASIQDVAGRFGTLLVVPLALVVLAFVTAVIRLGDIASLALSFGMLGMLAAIVLTVYSFKKEAPEPDQGLDALYGVMITFLIMLIVLYLIGRSILGSIMGSFF